MIVAIRVAHLSKPPCVAVVCTWRTSWNVCEVVPDVAPLAVTQDQVIEVTLRFSNHRSSPLNWSMRL